MIINFSNNSNSKNGFVFNRFLNEMSVNLGCFFLSLILVLINYSSESLTALIFSGIGAILSVGYLHLSWFEEKFRNRNLVNDISVIFDFFGLIFIFLAFIVLRESDLSSKSWILRFLVKFCTLIGFIFTITYLISPCKYLIALIRDLINKRQLAPKTDFYKYNNWRNNKKTSKKDKTNKNSTEDAIEVEVVDKK